MPIVMHARQLTASTRHESPREEA